ncbi:DUF5719 family protein [Nocardioides marmorisolisilvae]|uniref:Uncharacterized protein n=1 Tax=Nocardioides marmorisolisilvae TaxID=1542737 RepID=A0A3N0DSN2_9ACTN|nr:DUF5719 family protein [Nocardioides marmorisolisilvae]RNL78634.1 hypothetical protein EFL95_05985 [Nocardioides marmorisolisilvae]
MSTPTPTRRGNAARRPAAIGIMLVGLTFALLTLAGTTPLGIGRPVDDPPRVKLDERVFSCTGGLGADRVLSGNLDTGLAKNRTVRSKPLRIVADRTVARGAFAGQESVVGKKLAWVPCPEPHAEWWFAGGGSAEITHDTVLTITNPRPGAAVIDVDVYGDDGAVTAPGLHGITIGGRSTRVVDLGRSAPTSGNVAVSVIASRGLVAVTAADTFAPGLIGKKVQEWLPPQPAPSKTLVLAGLPSKPGLAALTLVNPGSTEAIAKLEVIGNHGTFSPEGLAPVTVPPESVTTLQIADVIDGSPMAIRITTDGRVTGTIRTTKAGDTSFATGVQALRDSTSFGLPQGTGRLVLSSLGEAGSVKVTGYDSRGHAVLTRTVAVEAGTSAAVKLTSQVRYVQLVADRATVAGAFSMSPKNGIAAAGIAPAIRSTRLPAVRPGW